MKVLIVTNMYPDTDSEFLYKGIFVKEQVDGLNKTGVFDIGVHVIKGHKGLLAYLLGTFSVFFKVLFGKYDLIHCHYGLSAMFTLLLPFKRWNNVILTLHGGDILEKQGKSVQVFITKLILKRIGFVITLSNEMNEIVNSYTKKYQTLVCGADGELFTGDYNKKEITTFLFPGRPDREVKNFVFFEEIVNAYNDSGRESKIIVLDGFSRLEIAKVLREGSLLLMTSHSEGSPQIIKEAMLSDVPILSCNVGDVASVVGDTPGTCIYYENDAVSVSVRIDALVEEASQSIGKRRQRIFDVGLEQKNIIKQLSDIYLRLNTNVK